MQFHILPKDHVNGSILDFASFGEPADPSASLEYVAADGHPV